MKRTVNVVQVRHPKSGRYIGEGHHNYFLTPDGAPTMHFSWRGLLFNGTKKMEFVFSRDVVQIGLVDQDAAESAARWSAFNDWSSRGAAGLVANLVVGGVAAAAARTSGVKGFGVLYKNDHGQLAAFMAVASPEIVDEIFRAVPAEKHEQPAEPSEPPQPEKSSET